jgi:hypothetical protein
VGHPVYTVSGFARDGRANGERHQVLGGSEWMVRYGGGGIKDACVMAVRLLCMVKYSLKMDLTEGSEMSANHNLTPGKYPNEHIQYSEHGESLKSRIIKLNKQTFY